MQNQLAFEKVLTNISADSYPTKPFTVSEPQLAFYERYTISLLVDFQALRERWQEL